MNEINVIKEIVKISPVSYASLVIDENTGLIIVDEINGFCTPGYGPLAPVGPNAQVDHMIAETNKLAKMIKHKLVLIDRHRVGQVEKPYPPHCEVGSGQDELVDKLKWLEGDSNSVILPKDCISGVVGGMNADGSNVVFDWIKNNGIRTVVVVGICTDICNLGVVLPLMSARARGLVELDEVYMHEPACASYDLSLEVARSIGLPDSAAHPQDLYHLMGLLIAQNQGVVITR